MRHLRSPSLTEDERNRFGAIHPSFMGGEYLPDCNPSETEIARVKLRSTTQDLISIRATREDESFDTPSSTNTMIMSSACGLSLAKSRLA